MTNQRLELNKCCMMLSDEGTWGYTGDDEQGDCF